MYKVYEDISQIVRKDVRGSMESVVPSFETCAGVVGYGIAIGVFTMREWLPVSQCDNINYSIWSFMDDWIENEL